MGLGNWVQVRPFPQTRIWFPMQGRARGTHTQAREVAPEGTFSPKPSILRASNETLPIHRMSHPPLGSSDPAHQQSCFP